MKTVRLQRWGRDTDGNSWVYVDTSKTVGNRDHLKVFANRDAADAWLAKNDPESYRLRIRGVGR
jgi:hypothetical protein